LEDWLFDRDLTDHYWSDDDRKGPSDDEDIVVTRPRMVLELEGLKGTAEEQLRLELISKECTTHLQRSN
jgi:hypothetical protein